MTEADQRMS